VIPVLIKQGTWSSCLNPSAFAPLHVPPPFSPAFSPLSTRYFILKTQRFLKTKKKNCYIIIKEVTKMTQSANRLTNLQLELLKLFKYNLSQKQLLEVKDLLAKYFADKATREMDKLWEEKGLTDETMDSWLNEHMRTPSE
jgi:hypothetical protein